MVFHKWDCMSSEFSECKILESDSEPVHKTGIFTNGDFKFRVPQHNRGVLRVLKVQPLPPLNFIRDLHLCCSLTSPLGDLKDSFAIIIFRPRPDLKPEILNLHSLSHLMRPAAPLTAPWSFSWRLQIFQESDIPIAGTCSWRMVVNALLRPKDANDYICRPTTSNPIGRRCGCPYVPQSY